MPKSADALLCKRNQLPFSQNSDLTLKICLNNILAPVCEYCSLFFLQAQFFLKNTLVIEENKHHLSDPWLLPAKLYGLS
jgi:hypothetical protein